MNTAEPDINGPIMQTVAAQTSGAGEPQTFDIEAIPPPSFGTMIFLERIRSPFVRPPMDAQGNLAVDAQGKSTAAAVQVIPTMEEVAQTLYILFNQGNPVRLNKMISNPEALSAAVMEMSSRIRLDDVRSVIGKINEWMGRINQSQREYNMTGAEGKAAATGSTPHSTSSSPSMGVDQPPLKVG